MKNNNMEKIKKAIDEKVGGLTKEQIILIVEHAIYDIYDLKEICRKYVGSLEDLCKELGGHNLDTKDHYFDINYNSILTTVKEVNGKFEVLKREVYVYADTVVDNYNSWYEILTLNFDEDIDIKELNDYGI